MEAKYVVEFAQNGLWVNHADNVGFYHAVSLAKWFMAIRNDGSVTRIRRMTGGAQ